MPKTRKELEQEWLAYYGEELPKFIHRSYADKYLNWSRKNGELDKSIQKQIDKLIEGVNKGFINSSIKVEIKVGTKLIREFKGVKYEVVKCEAGYKYDNKIYKSLSAIANEITGTRWNGKKFFGLV